MTAECRSAQRAQRAAPQRSAPRAERSQPQAQPRAQRLRSVERAAARRRSRKRNGPSAASSSNSSASSASRAARRAAAARADQRAERQQREQTATCRAPAARAAEAGCAEAATGPTRPSRRAHPERSGPQRVNRIQASNEQRKGVRDRIFRERRVDRITKRDFRARVAIGSRIDRRHHRHLHRLTPAILAFAPIYAGYSYLVVDDDICIVDPATYYVVDVIPSSVEYAGRLIAAAAGVVGRGHALHLRQRAQGSPGRRAHPSGTRRRDPAAASTWSASPAA